MNEFDLDIFMIMIKWEVTEKNHIKNPYLNTELVSINMKILL